MAEFELMPSPGTCHWGSFDASLEPVLEIVSGDRVRLTSVSGNDQAMPANFGTIPQSLLDIQKQLRPDPGPHILTGPIAIRGAAPGDLLEVRILDIEPYFDWGYTLTKPLWGTLPEDFPQGRLIHSKIDKTAMTATLPWGQKLALKPFFGVMGVAPPPEWGRLSTTQPRAHGGNLDNKQLVPGTTLYLPVWTEGALFSAGDGHGVQGDGEVCLSAIETGLTGTFEFHLRTDIRYCYPRAETPSHWITMAAHEDLDQAAKNALRSMIELIQEHTERDATEAYMLCSLAADMCITQLVNEQKGCHCMLAKSALQ